MFDVLIGKFVTAMFVCLSPTAALHSSETTFMTGDETVARSYIESGECAITPKPMGWKILGVGAESETGLVWRTELNGKELFVPVNRQKAIAVARNMEEHASND